MSTAPNSISQAPGTPGRSHSRAPSLSEMVLNPDQTAPSTPNEEDQLPLAEHHDALIGAEFKNPESIVKQPTLATLGDTPFTSEGDQVEHHRVVATEFVDPVKFEEPEPVLQNALVLLDPRIPDCIHLIEAGKKRGLMVMAVVPKPSDGSRMVEFYPTAEALLECGIHQVYEPPMGSKFDIVECAAMLKTIEAQQNLRFLGVVPCREASVDFSDILGALLGLTVVNDLGLANSRRDKGLMKVAVANAGLRVAKYARLTQRDGSDALKAISELELTYPVVVKTPRGMSTMDVYICNSADEALKHTADIVRSVGPDGRRTQYALLEEFLEGEEFAINLLASPTTPRGVQVTDIWLYHKINTEGTMVNTYQEMVDPHDRVYSELARYAEGVCRAVGIKYGMAHVELKAKYDDKRKKWIDPVMIEVGARLAGGRKAIMAQETIPDWQPFDAMVDAHCGFPVRMPPSFTPKRYAIQTYVSADKAGIIKRYHGEDFDRLPTYNSHLLLKKVGEMVTPARDLTSFAAYVWLIGDPEAIRRDANRARAEFFVDVALESLVETPSK